MNLRMPRLQLCLITLALVAALAGCNRRTPEERLEAAAEFMQQNDVISAEMEARKVIEKAPDDPASIQARHLLASIYMREERLDEAKAELEAALEKVSQKEEIGKKTLQAYLFVLQRAKDHKAALETIDKYQKEYASDEGTSLSLEVARVEVQTAAGETTTARNTLFRLKESTTSPAELILYRNLIAGTFQRDNDTTSGIAFFETELAETTDEKDKQHLVSALARSYAAVEDYERTRDYVVQATQMYDRSVAGELDANARTAMTYDLARLYSSVGNLAGARLVFQAIFDSNPANMELVMAAAQGLGEILMRQGQYEAFIGFMREAAQRYPNLPFALNAAQFEAMHQRGELSARAPMDTTTLVMKFREAERIVPKNLPKSSLAATTGTATAATTTDTATIAETTVTETTTATTETDRAATTSTEELATATTETAQASSASTESIAAPAVAPTAP